MKDLESPSLMQLVLLLTHLLRECSVWEIKLAKDLITKRLRYKTSASMFY